MLLDQAVLDDMLLAVPCRDCSHEANFLAADLKALAAPVRSVRALPFRCIGCGSHNGEVAACKLNRDRLPDFVVRRPVRPRR